MRCLVSVLLLTVCIARPVLAQAPDEYARLAALYADDPAGAVRTVAALPRDTITQGVNACIATACQPPDLMHRALLHLDVGDYVMGLDIKLGQFHLDSGIKLLTRLQAMSAATASVGQSDRRRILVGRCYAYAARVYLTFHYVPLAPRMLRQ
ncbi:MAG: hypothetical protein LBQ09_02060, partial [Acidobacteriaceae bacterium]|nr:hypothetical protein [Acidobacteriaceae bacterium]